MTPNFINLNFVQTCQTTDQYTTSLNTGTNANDDLATSTTYCYNSSTALNEILLVTGVFFIIMILTIKMFFIRKS